MNIERHSSSSHMLPALNILGVISTFVSQAQLSKKVLESGWAEGFTIFERMFAISSPMMHSEDLQLQNMGIEICTKWEAEYKQAGNEQAAATMDQTMGFAKDHLRVIQRFGRFPSRNQAMGRENTPEEEKYIKEEMISVWEKSQASIGKK